MAKKVVKSNLFNESSIEITGASNRYDLRWNTKNGDVEVVQRGVVLDGTPIVLFENHKWSQWAIDNATKDSGGSFDYVPDGLANDASRIAKTRQIADLLLAAHKANGGGKLPEWVLEMDKLGTDDQKNLLLTDYDDGIMEKTAIIDVKIEEKKPKPPAIWSNIKKTDVTLSLIHI